MAHELAPFHRRTVSALSSLMLACALLSAYSPSPRVVTAGWTLPAPIENAAPQMGQVRTVSASVPVSQPELAPIVKIVEDSGINTFVDATTSQLLNLGTERISVKAKGFKDADRVRGVAVAMINDSLYVLILDRTPSMATIYSMNVEGQMIRGVHTVKGHAPIVLDPVHSDFLAQKDFWKQRLLGTAVASNASGS